VPERVSEPEGVPLPESVALGETEVESVKVDEGEGEAV